MAFELLGMGTAAPEHFIEQHDAAALAETLMGAPEDRRPLATLFRRAMVKQRHSVLLDGSSNGQPALQDFYYAAESAADGGPSTAVRMQRYEAEASKLALAAAERAINAAHVDVDVLTHLVTVSCSGFRAPGVDIDLITSLGLSRDIARTHVGFMGCHGAMNGLRVARALAESDPNAFVLLCAVELCSLHCHYGQDTDQIVANALFADGAAAVVGRSSASEGDDNWRLVASGSSVIPQTEELMHWQIRDNGFEMALSPKVPEVIRAELRPWMEKWLMKHSLRIEDVASWAVHPGGPKILSACGEVLGLSENQLQASWDVLSEFGNMSSPTVLYILDKLRKERAKLPCVALGFGPGLAIEASLWV